MTAVRVFMAPSSFGFLCTVRVAGLRAEPVWVVWR
jgi:hypothetical protein